MDFHYMMTILHSFIKLGHEYSINLVKAITDPDTANSVHVGATAKQTEHDIINVKKQLEEWDKTKAASKENNVNTESKKKITRSQWQQEAFMLRMQKVAKRRRGFHKQAMLEFKALKIKGKPY